MITEDQHDHLEATAAEPGPRRILLVDDYADVRRILSWALSRAGYEVSTAADASEALSLIHEQLECVSADGRRRLALDLIILDIMMPQVNGIELLDLLARTFPALPRVMMVSALDDPRRVAEALRLGATDYLPKPVDADMLLHKVQSVLGEPSQSPFHWARFPRLLSMTVGEHPAVGTSICESGLIVELPDGASLAVGDVVPMESAFFEQLGTGARVHGRVIREVQLQGPAMAELTFVGLPQRAVARVRAFTLTH